MHEFPLGFNALAPHGMVGDRRYYIDTQVQMRSAWQLVMSNPVLAIDLYNACEGQTHVIHRDFSPLQGKQWYTQTARSYAETLSAGTDPRIWLYGLNEPNPKTPGEVAILSQWLAEVVHIVCGERGKKIVVGNFASGSWDLSHIFNGLYDPLLIAIAAYPEQAVLGVHEYCAVLMPFTHQRWDINDLRDRDNVQPDLWLELDHPDAALQLPDYRTEVRPWFYHLLRSHWFEHRARDLGLGDIPIVITEFGTDRLQDIERLPDNIYDYMKHHHGVPEPYAAPHGFYANYKAWQYYFPQWTVTEALFYQLQNMCRIYDSRWYKGLLLFMWGFDRGQGEDFESRGFNTGADRDLHQRLIAESQVYHASEPPPVPPVIIEEPDTMIDLLAYLRGDGRVYELVYSFPGMGSGRQHVQTERTDGRRFFHVKGHRVQPDQAQWEELWFDDRYIYRGTDTSPSQHELYQVTENGVYGQRWVPRRVRVGDQHRANPLVMFRYKADGRQVPEKAVYAFPHWIEVKHIYDRYTFPDGFVLDDVVELWGYLDTNGQPGDNFERYYYAKHYGLVAWTDPHKNWVSYIVADYGHDFTLQRLHPDWLVLPELPPLDEETDPVTFPDLDDPRWQTVFLSASDDYDFWNVRPQPNIQQPRVTKIDRGQNRHALILTDAPSEQSDGVWYPVRLADDLYAPLDDSPGTRELYHITGWVRADGIAIEDYTPTPDPEPAPDPRVFQYFIPSAEVGLTPSEAQDRADWIDWFLSHHLDGMPGATIEGDRHWFRWLSDFVRNLPTILDGHDAIMIIEPPDEGD